MSRLRHRRQVKLAGGFFCLIVGCAGVGSIIPPEVLEDPVAKPKQDWHRGPSVDQAPSGSARFVPKLHEGFDVERAMETVRFTDRFYRAPANPYYDQVIDHLAERLRAAGFGGEDARFELRVLEEGLEAQAWTPKSASVELLAPGRDPRVLHAFDSPEAVDRTMLPVNAPACDLEAKVALSLADLEEGEILLTDVTVSQVLARAEQRGAAAIVSSSLGIYNQDPSGQERHLVAVQFRKLPPGTELPVFQISPRSHEAIRAAAEEAAEGGSAVSLRVRAEVALEDRPLRTLVASIVGGSRPDEAVAMVSHVQEPGACDNASGVGGLLESAVSLAGLLQAGEIDWPRRSLVFIWGDEFRQSRSWLRSTERTPIAALSSDMTGQSKDTGAIALLERMPDPGALVTLPPDAHTPWGAGDVTREDLTPSGFAVIARCAMVDVGALEGGWSTADHPWEGGSDHDVFIEQGIPAVLIWHFTDFTYHTSLDRLEFVDPAEVRRTAVAILATAMAAADPRPGDLERYLKSLDMEKEVRIAAARDAKDEEVEALWEEWCQGAREWLRNQCLGIDEKIPTPR